MRGRGVSVQGLLARAGQNVFLALFFGEAARDGDGAPRVGVDPGVVHAGGGCEWRGGENLHLFRVEVQFARGESFEFRHVGRRTPRVGGDEIVGQKLTFPVTLAGGIERPLEGEEIFDARLAHRCEHMGDDVFGGQFKLAGNMVLRDRFDVTCTGCPVGGG